ncbi:hypothetical protein QP278_23085 [Escherichia coli]|nr:hypothetical protein [Escherichia coli]
MYNRDKIVQIKRVAVKTVFWTACPMDDDYGYDRIMSASMIDRTFQDKHAIYVHDAYEKLCDTNGIKQIVRDAGVRLVILMENVTPEVAETILNQWATTEVLYEAGTEGTFDYLLR